MNVKRLTLIISFNVSVITTATTGTADNLMSGFRAIENLEVLACRNSAERIVSLLNRGEIDQAKQLARKHEIAWHLADREFQNLNQPHRNNDFCDDE
jgi:hypothetical protein